MTILHLAKKPTPEEVSADLVRKMLTAAVDEGLEHVTVIGAYSDGSTYFASSLSYGPDLLWDLKIAERTLMDASEGGE